MGNTFIAADPWIEIQGEVDSNKTLDSVDNLGNYRLSSHLTINNPAVLTLAPGVELSSHNTTFDIYVDGRMEAEDAIISLMYEYFNDYATLYVRTGGSLDLKNSTIKGKGIVEVQSNGLANFHNNYYEEYNPSYWINNIFSPQSNIVMNNCYGIYDIEIDSNSILSAFCNDFSQTYIYAEGEPSKIINFENNWWGTTDPNIIEDSIFHQFDDGNLPLVDFDPYLEFPCIAGDFEPDGDVDLLDFAIFASAWLSTEGNNNWNEMCNLVAPDNIIDMADLVVFADNWLAGIQ